MKRTANLQSLAALAAGMLAAALGVSSAAEPQPAQGDLQPTYLRTEYLVNPLGLDTPQPRLS